MEVNAQAVGSFVRGVEGASAEAGLALDAVKAARAATDATGVLGAIDEASFRLGSMRGDIGLARQQWTTRTAWDAAHRVQVDTSSQVAHRIHAARQAVEGTGELGERGQQALGDAQRMLQQVTGWDLPEVNRLALEGATDGVTLGRANEHGLWMTAASEAGAREGALLDDAARIVDGAGADSWDSAFTSELSNEIAAEGPVEGWSAIDELERTLQTEVSFGADGIPPVNIPMPEVRGSTHTPVHDEHIVSLVHHRGDDSYVLPMVANGRALEVPDLVTANRLVQGYEGSGYFAATANEHGGVNLVQVFGTNGTINGAPASFDDVVRGARGTPDALVPGSLQLQRIWSVSDGRVNLHLAPSTASPGVDAEVARFAGDMDTATDLGAAGIANLRSTLPDPGLPLATVTYPKAFGREDSLALQMGRPQDTTFAASRDAAIMQASEKPGFSALHEVGDGQWAVTDLGPGTLSPGKLNRLAHSGAKGVSVTSHDGSLRGLVVTGTNGRHVIDL